MKMLIAFSKKDALELIRTYKAFILLMVFLALGFMNPLTANYLPELVSSFLPEGMSMQLSEPTIMDSWLQFFKNVPQIGLIVFVIMCSTFVSSDFYKGTLINLLTKGLSRTTVILSKFFTSSLFWTICYVLTAAVSYGYNFLFWSEGIAHLPFALFMVWMFGIVLIAFIVLGSVLTNSSSGAFLLCGGFLLICMILSLFPQAQGYNPICLITDNIALLQGKTLVQDYTGSISISIIIIIISLLCAVLLFRKKQL